MKIKGQIVKAVAGRFDVTTEEGKICACSIKGTVKRAKDVFVGDYCEVENGVISAIYPRKNELIRPYVANIDALIIVVAPVPKPDWICVEKLILNCHHQKITPVIVYNKCDLVKNEERENALKPYKNEFAVFALSAKSGEGVAEFQEYIKGKLVCFAGQSAVGKSSLINALGGDNLQVGDLSKKIARGKNTTRHVEIYDLSGARAVDTCGFSVMESVDIDYDELVYYYDEFLAFQKECKYTNCTHTNEPGCAVKRELEKGAISAERYGRYLKLYNALKESRRKKYD